MGGWIKTLSRAASSLGHNLVALMRRLRRPVTFAVCRFFMRLHINQTHLTVTRIFLLVGVYFAWINSALSIALGLMLAAWLLDCLDGDLSRMLKNDNAVGEFEDVFGDNLVFLIFPLALIQSGLLSGVLGALSIFAAYSVLWMADRKQSPDGDMLAFHPRGDLFLGLSRKAIWVLMYFFIFFRFDIFAGAYIAVTAILLISLVINYFQIIRSRLKPL